jgi:hypothetical protein
VQRAGALLLAPFLALGGVAGHFPLASFVAWGLALGLVIFAARRRGR